MYTTTTQRWWDLQKRIYKCLWSRWIQPQALLSEPLFTRQTIPGSQDPVFWCWTLCFLYPLWGRQVSYYTFWLTIFFLSIYLDYYLFWLIFILINIYLDYYLSWFLSILIAIYPSILFAIYLLIMIAIYLSILISFYLDCYFSILIAILSFYLIFLSWLLSRQQSTWSFLDFILHLFHYVAF